MFEIDMVNTCYDYFLSCNNDYTKVVREVPFLSRCIDIVLITKESKSITIEFKINNWRKALEQAKNHKLGADKAYICLPEKNFSKELIYLLEQEQIGLYIFNPNSSCIIKEYYSIPFNDRKVNLFGEILLQTTTDLSEKLVNNNVISSFNN